MVTVNFRCGDFNLTNWNSWFVSFLVSCKEILIGTTSSGMEYGIIREIYTPYAGASGILLHINGKFTMGKLKSSLLS
jgi:hypothetical protein